MTDFQTPSFDELVRIEREARRLQAEAFASGFRSIVRRAGAIPGAISGLMGRRVHG